MPDKVDYDLLPGLRDYSGAAPSHHGIQEILAVIDRLAAAEIPSCVVGVKALRYYGAARLTDVGRCRLENPQSPRSLTVRKQEWDLCIPDERLEDACALLLRSDDGDAKYEVAKPPPPVPWSLRHTFPCFQLRGYNFWFILTPSSDCFVDPSNPDHVEKSRNGVPYASIVQFARSLLLQNMTADIADFVDGMDLTIEWGEQNIGFDTLQEESARFIEIRNQRVKTHSDDSGWLSPQALRPLWEETASKEAKEKRIEPMKQGRYFTRWRRIKSPEDPRTKDRPV